MRVARSMTPTGGYAGSKVFFIIHHHPEQHDVDRDEVMMMMMIVRTAHEVAPRGNGMGLRQVVLVP